MNKKLGVLVIFLISLSLINAGSVGISPARIKLFFEPNLEREFTFKASNTNPDEGIDIYAKGDLAEYVSLSETYLQGKGSFIASLKLPEKINIPGKHEIFIGVIESSTQEGGVGGVAAVQAVIEIFVPYPGKYVEVAFELENINEGEIALFELDVNNLGTQDVDVVADINVYEAENIVLTKTLEIGKIK